MKTTQRISVNSHDPMPSTGRLSGAPHREHALDTVRCVFPGCGRLLEMVVGGWVHRTREWDVERYNYMQVRHKATKAAPTSYVAHFPHSNPEYFATGLCGQRGLKDLSQDEIGGLPVCEKCLAKAEKQ